MCYRALDNNDPTKSERLVTLRLTRVFCIESLNTLRNDHYIDTLCETCNTRVERTFGSSLFEDNEICKHIL